MLNVFIFFRLPRCHEMFQNESKYTLKKSKEIIREKKNVCERVMGALPLISQNSSIICDVRTCVPFPTPLIKWRAGPMGARGDSCQGEEFFVFDDEEK